MMNSVVNDIMEFVLASDKDGGNDNMANKRELIWYGKDEPIRIEPRQLIEIVALSNTVNTPDTENMIIHGDNLLALKALESKYAGQVKCIYIDIT
jgi:adenine-specific DNA-methyltransferase